MANTSRKVFGYVLSVAFLGLAVLGWTERFAIYDWSRLRDYSPPADVVQLATDTTMTAGARRLLYVNHPVVEGRDTFSQHCPNNGGEQTIVLGCYHDHETGIFLFDVNDQRLDGVEQVTAAHETLHAGYERLNSKDRTYVDGLLQDFYQHGLHDQRVIDTIKAYEKTEPNDVVNEMHSVFGTEVMDLPQPLETYYQRYFTNRRQVAAYAAQYESSFTTLKNQASQLEQQLKNLHSEIDSQEQQLAQEQAALDADRGSISTQAEANAFNARVRAYNSKVGHVNELVNEYNSLRDQYNQLATQQQQLFQALDSRPTAATQ